MQRALAVTALLLLSGCRPDPPSGATPREALARLGPCVDAGDAGCLFRELDRDSRWSVHTIHRSLVEARELVERSYPEDQQAGALGTWSAASRAADPAEAFSVMAVARGWPALVAAGFGAAVEVRQGDAEEAEITTTRGRILPFAARDGEWGLALWREKLRQDKLRVLDILEQVRENADAFDEQRAALADGPQEEE